MSRGAAFTQARVFECSIMYITNAALRDAWSSGFASRCAAPRVSLRLLSRGVVPLPAKLCGTNRGAATRRKTKARRGPASAPV